MSLVRKLVGTHTYREHQIEIRHMGPDLLTYVDGIELNAFYINTQAAYEGGTRHVDYVEKEKEKEKRK